MAEQPSMDEILASIRRILSSETAGAPTAQAPMVELTEAMCVPAQPTPKEVVEKPAPVTQPRQEAPLQTTTVQAPEPKVVEPMPIPQPIPQPQEDEESVPDTQEAQALDSVFLTVLKPLLREWLDKNMPRLLEKCIRQELQATQKDNNDNTSSFSF